MLETVIFSVEVAAKKNMPIVLLSKQSRKDTKWLHTCQRSINVIKCGFKTVTAKNQNFYISHNLHSCRTVCQSIYNQLTPVFIRNFKKLMWKFSHLCFFCPADGCDCIPQLRDRRLFYVSGGWWCLYCLKHGELPAPCKTRHYRAG